MNNTANQQNEDNIVQQNRSIRIFVSSTFKDMIEDRNTLMTHAWPELRLFCRERFVEIVEVDLRWGITDEQIKRKELLKLCLDEIKACRPFFVGLLGECYGTVPTDDTFTPDIKEEQPWIKDNLGKSITELEILHGVLNSPEMAGRAFFYFRDPIYAKEHGSNFLPKDEAEGEKQTVLKNLIRTTCEEKNIPLRETYPNPEALAALVLEQLKDAIETQFPKADLPDPLDREARDHEASAEIRCRTYIGRAEYFDALDRHANTESAPLVLLGESGSGKSALLSNWIDRWHKVHPNDCIFQHYIGSTPDSAVHWKLMTRLMAEIKRWTDDPDELPSSNDEILKNFPLWLAKARIKAQRDGIRFIVVLDALNQLDKKDHGHLLGWLPEHPFTGTLKLIVSTLPGDTLEVVEKRTWPTLRIQPLTINERREMTVNYLKRFGKKLDNHLTDHIANSETTANPLYLKILLDELKVTGTHDNLKKRLDDYLAEREIPGLLVKILKRYERDYERDRKGLVSEVLGLIWSARRGLTEIELLQLLRPTHLPQLPLASWSPLRAALEESLVDRGGIFNFSHDFLRTAVETIFLPDPDTKKKFRIILADFFESQSATARNCDELPWLLWKTGKDKRLRSCILNIDNFLEIRKREIDEIRSYWVYLNEERNMGKPYLLSFDNWVTQKTMSQKRTAYAANELGLFLNNAALHTETESLLKKALKIHEDSFGEDHPDVARVLNNLALLLHDTNRLDEAEHFFRRAIKINEESLGETHPDLANCLANFAALLRDTNHLDEAEQLLRRALKIDVESFGENHPKVATDSNDLALLLHDTNRLGEAEPLFKRALKIREDSFGKNHPSVATSLNNLALLLHDTNRLGEAEQLLRRALKIDVESFGENHPKVATNLKNLARCLLDTNRLDEAEQLLRRALKIDVESFGENHPKVAICLSILAGLLRDTNRLDEAEHFFRRAIKINEESFGETHPDLARDINNLALLLQTTDRLGEAEQHFKRALKITEESLGKTHPKVATCLANLARLLQATNRLNEAEPLYIRAIKINEESLGETHPDLAICLCRFAHFLFVTKRLDEAESLIRRGIEIFIIFTRTTGHQHPHLQTNVNNYKSLLQVMGWSEKQIIAQIRKIAPEIFNT